MKRSLILPNRRFPNPVMGFDLIKHIKTGKPKINGPYLVLYKPYPLEAKENFPTSGLKVTMWVDERWHIGETVLAWLGPLPILSIDEITQDTLNFVSFGIGYLKEVIKNKYIMINIPQYLIAKLRGEALKVNKTNLFIFEINSHKTLPTPLAKWESSKGKWDKLDEKSKKKYLLIMKAMKRKNRE